MPATILVVEDDPVILQLLAGQLRDGGLHRHHARPTAQEGVDRTRAERPDVIVSDMMMPSACRASTWWPTSRATPTPPPIPVCCSRPRPSRPTSRDGLAAGRRRLRHQALRARSTWSTGSTASSKLTRRPPRQPAVVIRDDLDRRARGRPRRRSASSRRPRSSLERPARREHGDWSSNVAMATAKAAGRNPRELGQRAGRPPERPTRRPTSRKVEVAGPGLRQLPPRRRPGCTTCSPRSSTAGDRRLRPARRSAPASGCMIEFVSANPTGPVHVGNGWFASYGDALGRLLERCGYDVTREYYVNDTGGQIRRARRERAGPRARASRCPRAATRAPS